ncbi:short-chain dehydrogenase/reductase SDR [Streptomyces zinciresistens K42]|uniref:Short-chain dehydrogenase/reductase SDR n=1 Tax=Streptomyces zinciresistens K42 TaxID=700597 RepID=G2GER2_9ACTN|nr:SDR family oxidoreductase [Streptomyces zinciresistens]EGX58023.1 short-chain dehydrogenase/reductase SDR [Streptomyces zinciresistens K42]
MRTVVITGASSGIGRATALRFTEAGDHVVNLDLKAPEPDGSPAGRWIRADTADWDAVRDALADVHRERGRLDVVVANAGISVRHGVLDIQEKDARRVTDVNLLGVLGVWQAAARIMTGQGHGVLLATASVNGRRGYPRYADYNATKAGIVALTQTFALELSPVVRAACVSPGGVLTPMQLAEYTEQMLADTNARIPAGRHADPAEIAAAFFYLASAEARFITGQELVIDGGETAGATTSAYGTAVPAGH